MGARENQGMQFALIVFVVITVVLCVTTYIYWKRSDELTAERAADRTAKEKSDEDFRRVVAELQEVKQVLGHAPAATPAEIKSQQLKDMNLFAESYPGPRSYLTLPAFLLDEIAKRNRLVADLEALNDTLAADVRQASLQGQAQLAVSQTDRDNRIKELAAVRATFVVDRSRFVKDNDKIAGQLEAQGKRVAVLADEHKKEVGFLQSSIANLQRMVGGLKMLNDKLRPKGEAETADGKITFVDQRSRTVGIDLGSVDGLRRAMTFTVVDRDAAKVGSARKKGTIEVVTIDSAHSAIGKIESDDLRDPILYGDQIFTAAWQPGQKVRFAFTGLLDLDGDGHSDRGTIRSLIERHGAVIDAEADDQGQIKGNVEFETRYLVVGQRPSERTHEAALKSYMALITEAERIGVEKLPLDKFLQMVGYRPSEKTIQLKRAPAGEPPARLRGALPE